MQLIKLLRREVTGPSHWLVVFGLLSGVSNASLVAVINGAKESERTDIEARYYHRFERLSGTDLLKIKGIEVMRQGK